MLLLLTLLGVSIVGLIGLFSLKWWEVQTGTVLFATPRAHADDAARSVKQKILLTGLYIKRLPFVSVLILRYFIHVSAKAFARFARKVEEASHRLADRVSHKHRFQRRESSSRFLKEVTEHKNGLAPESD